MMHPLAVVSGVFEEHFESWQGLNGSSLISLEFAEDDAARGFRGGSKWSLQPMGGGPKLEAFKLLAKRTPPEHFHDEYQRRFGHNLMFSIMCEDMPDPENRVVLSANMTDSSGLAAPKLIYRTSDDAKACLDHACEQAEAIFHDAGAWATEAHNPAPYNAHFMGTARMGDDATRSVVNRWGMSHDIPNLGIIDGSVFVTSGAVNPTTTICALALRTARQLAGRRSVIPVPDLTAPRLYDMKPLPAAAAIRPAVLDECARAKLTALGDALIPPGELPGAGTLIVAAGLVERVLEARPDLVTPLASALSALTPGDDLAVFHALAGSDLAAWMGTLDVIAGAWCLHPEVRARLGYAGQMAKPVRLDSYPAYLAEGLLDHLLDGTWATRQQVCDPGKHALS
jgi:hypothetical protein